MGKMKTESEIRAANLAERLKKAEHDMVSLTGRVGSLVEQLTKYKRKYSLLFQVQLEVSRKIETLRELLDIRVKDGAWLDVREIAMELAALYLRRDTIAEMIHKMQEWRSSSEPDPDVMAYTNEAK